MTKGHSFLTTGSCFVSLCLINDLIKTNHTVIVSVNTFLETLLKKLLLKKLTCFIKTNVTEETLGYKCFKTRDIF